ncbi:MAG: 5'-methylthioadenosine phosphorylase [Puniceicoccaceae bacterium 5H]|nr:MAG: 5'-methylthioadenosine phosphorylase [Puniceicoccaceae bacterium 5H]
MATHLDQLPLIEAPDKVCIALIGGTHLNDAIERDGGLEGRFTVETPEGTSPPFYLGQYEEVPYIYVHFHGDNQWLQTWLGLHQLGVRNVLTGATAGGIHPAYRLFDLVVPDDFGDLNIDRPTGIPLQYLEGPTFAFPRFTPPMDATLRQILIEEARKTVRARRELDDISIHPVGSVWQARGGRFETASEIRALRQQGADLVTLNVATEITYARQLGLHLACLNVISNPAEGVGDWTWDTIRQVYRRLNPICTEIMLRCLPRIAAIPADAPRSGDTLREHPPFTTDQ